MAAAGEGPDKDRSVTDRSDTDKSDTDKPDKSRPGKNSERKVLLPLSGPRLEQMVQDFVARADELIQAQQRMQSLLSAVVSLAEDLSLEAVLDRVVHSACQLVGAQFGALGVIGDHEELTHFITVGIDEHEASLIGELPTGNGVLGHLIREPRPLRLHDLTRHPRAAGFPPNHPPMRSFLGVPVMVRGTVFGNLYLTEKRGGEDFTEEDEVLAIALAAAAGVAIENARLYEEARRRQRWLEAGMDVSGRLMAANPEGAASGLELIAERALRESESTLALIAVPEAAGTLRCVTSVGTQALSAGQSVPVSSPVIARVQESGESESVSEAAQLIGAGESDKLGPALVASLRHQGTEGGVLVLARARGAMTYSPTDVEMSAVYCSRAALALELARANRLREQDVVFTDRDRIARDLHDVVIQRLFAAGLSMQSLRRFTTDGVALERINTVTGELDSTIRELRDTIYSLRRGAGSEAFSSRILSTVQEVTKSLALTPHLDLAGEIDTAVPDAVAEHLLAVLSEGLSNAVRHSGATAIDITVAEAAGSVEVLITDDGRGFSRPARRSGLANIEQRARILGGELAVDSRPGHGTRLRWTVPLG